MITRWRYLWTLFFISICFIALCTLASISLFHNQVSVAKSMKKNVERWRVSTELDECFRDILTLLRDKIESVAPLHDRARKHLKTIRALAVQAEEKDLANRLDSAFATYIQVWQTMPPPGEDGHEISVMEVSRILDSDLLRLCGEFDQYNLREVQDLTLDHQRLLRQLSWGIASISGLGGIAGLVLGFGIARGMRLSIQRLQIQIRDVAGHLDPDLPEIVLTGEGDLASVHENLAMLQQRIEAVVKELRQREVEVLRAEQLAAVGQLAAGVAHEIRNPLTSIKMLVQAELEDHVRTGLPTEDLRIIEKEIRRMETSLRTFIDFARPAKTERRPADVVPLIQTVVGLIRGRALKQDVRVVFNAPPDPVVVTVDAEQIQQVLVNLTLNALDAMPGGGALTVEVERREDRGVEIRVADTGPGLSAEAMRRLFEPFASTKDTGLGLGLVISRRIMENHGGTISAANKPGSGAVFSIRLPADMR